MTTINDIANTAGVSVATVSRAFSPNANISDSTRAAILQIAEELNYRPKKLPEAHNKRIYDWCNHLL